jgi:hypothetical protein
MHGARTGAPEGWSTASRTVETFCPTDESTLDAEGRLIPGIPDVTVNALLRILARHKGNNIVSVPLPPPTQVLIVPDLYLRRFLSFRRYRSRHRCRRSYCSLQSPILSSRIQHQSRYLGAGQLRGRSVPIPWGLYVAYSPSGLC